MSAEAITMIDEFARVRIVTANLSAHCFRHARF